MGFFPTWCLPDINWKCSLEIKKTQRAEFSREQLEYNGGIPKELSFDNIIVGRTKAVSYIKRKGIWS